MSTVGQGFVNLVVGEAISPGRLQERRSRSPIVTDEATEARLDSAVRRISVPNGIGAESRAPRPDRSRFLQKLANAWLNLNKARPCELLCTINRTGVACRSHVIPPRPPTSPNRRRFLLLQDAAEGYRRSQGSRPPRVSTQATPTSAGARLPEGDSEVPVRARR
jgi:hypothetical protein